MERLTNDRDQFLNQIKLELLEYESEKNSKDIFTYVEMPFFLTYAFSYNWSIDTQNSTYRLKRKEWNAAYDHSRFNKGIYNLDRLAIVEKEISINTANKDLLNSIDWDKTNTVEFKGIVLDGLICELHTHKEPLKWNINEEMNEELAKLIGTIRNWKRELNELNWRNRLPNKE